MAKKKHILLYEIVYHDKRSGKTITVPKGYHSDGATGAFDILSESWWVHDKICDEPIWDDGAPITNLQASIVLSTILIKEQRFVRFFTWFWMTWLFGCKKARKNGMW